MLERILIVLFILVVVIFSSVYMIESGDYTKTASFNSNLPTLFDLPSS